jgi:hypothetical protein
VFTLFFSRSEASNKSSTETKPPTAFPHEQ